MIVREANPSSETAERLVRANGGRVTHELPIVGGFSAVLPAKALNPLAMSRSVSHLWSDGRVTMSDVNMNKFDSMAPNTLWQSIIKLSSVQWDGTGVTVAVLDTGIIQSPDFGNRILATVDFTHEADGVDRYGHGTHMSGIIAGNGAQSGGKWTGVAPDANLVSVKVAPSDGSTDVSVVIAGLQWVIANKAQYNIRVLNLSFGTDSTQSYAVDPLDYAVEQVWNSGVLVVAAAGNRGPAPGTINKPGDDPYIVTVGAMDGGGTLGKPERPGHELLEPRPDAGRAGQARPGRPRRHDRVAPRPRQHHRHEPQRRAHRLGLLQGHGHVAGRRGGVGRRRPDVPGAAEPDPQPGQGAPDGHGHAVPGGERRRAGSGERVPRRPTGP